MEFWMKEEPLILQKPLFRPLKKQLTRMCPKQNLFYSPECSCFLKFLLSFIRSLVDTPFSIPLDLSIDFSIIGTITTSLPKSNSSTTLFCFMPYLFLMEAGITICPRADTVIVILFTSYLKYTLRRRHCQAKSIFIIPL